MNFQARPLSRRESIWILKLLKLAYPLSDKSTEAAQVCVRGCGKDTVSSGNGGLSSHSCIDSIAWSTVSIGNVGLRSMQPTIERVRYSAVKLSDPTQSYTVPMWPLFRNLGPIWTCPTTGSSELFPLNSLHGDRKQSRRLT